MWTKAQVYLQKTKSGEETNPDEDAEFQTYLAFQVNQIIHQRGGFDAQDIAQEIHVAALDWIRENSADWKRFDSWTYRWLMNRRRQLKREADLLGLSDLDEDIEIPSPAIEFSTRRENKNLRGVYHVINQGLEKGMGADEIFMAVLLCLGHEGTLVEILAQQIPASASKVSKLLGIKKPRVHYLRNKKYPPLSIKEEQELRLLSEGQLAWWPDKHQELTLELGKNRG